MDKNETQEIKNSLMHYGFDQVVSSGTSFFCFGKGIDEPKIGLSIYHSNPITHNKEKLFINPRRTR